MGIDIGEAAIDRDTGFFNGWTLISKGNPANVAGKISTVEIWASTSMSGIYVATFFELSPNYFSTRDWQAVSGVAAGAKRTRSVNLDVEIGDFIGIYFTGGTIKWSSSGGDNVRARESNEIPCTNVSFGLYLGNAMSLYGRGILTFNITSTTNIATLITSSISRGIKEVITATSNIATSVTSALSRGIKEVLTTTSNIAVSLTAVLNAAFRVSCNITTSVTSALSRGRKETLSSTIAIATSILTVLSRGIIEVLTSTTAISISITSTLSRGITEVLAALSIGVTSVVGSLNRGIAEAITSTINVTTSVSSTLSRGIIESLSASMEVILSVTNRLINVLGIWKEIDKPDTTYYEVCVISVRTWLSLANQDAKTWAKLKELGLTTWKKLAYAKYVTMYYPVTKPETTYYEVD